MRFASRIWQILGCTVLLFSLMASTATLAQAKENITLSPASQRYELVAGSSKDGQLTVINDGDTTYSFQVYANPFAVEDEDYKQSYRLPANTSDTSKWFTFQAKSYVMQPGQRQRLPYRISVPADAPPGGHYAVVFVETQPEGSGDTVVRKKRVGAVFYLTVKGETVSQGSVEPWKVGFWQPTPPLKTELRVKNSGNLHFDADVALRVTDIFGRQKFSLDKTLIILPQTVRRIILDWDRVPRIGLFKVSGSVRLLDHSEILPLRYVLILPWQVLAGVITVIVVLGLVSLVKRKSRHARKN